MKKIALFFWLSLFIGTLNGCATNKSRWYQPDPNTPIGNYFSTIRPELDPVWRKLVKEHAKTYYRDRSQIPRQKYSCRIDLDIDRDGNITRFRMNTSSEMIPLNEASMEVFDQIKKLPPPPPELINGSGTLAIAWDFVIEP